MLVVNRYTCPIKGKITIQAHDIQDGTSIMSYPKMSGDDLTLFASYKTILICDVVRSKNLSEVNILINKGGS